MRAAVWTLLLWLVAGSVSAQCLPPTCVNNIAGKVAPIEASVSDFTLVGGQQPDGTIDPAVAHAEFGFDPTELVTDRTQPPDAPKILITPDAAAASALTYWVSTMDSVTIISPTVIMVNNVSCSQATLTCSTPALLSILPNLGKGGTFVLRIQRAKPPQTTESVWSDPVTFTTPGGIPPPPPPPICVVSEWDEWSPWAPFVPQVVPPMETQHRNRTITNMPCVGTPLLTEVANRPVLITPPVKMCTYMAPSSNVFQQRTVGTVIEGNNYSAIGRGARMDQLFSWGWGVNGLPIFDPTGTLIGVHLTATCLGKP